MSIIDLSSEELYCCFALYRGVYYQACCAVPPPPQTRPPPIHPTTTVHAQVTPKHPKRVPFPWQAVRR